MLTPQSPAELAAALADAAAGQQSITLGGQFSKALMGGPVAPAGATISTSALDRVLEYEPRDLTISVEAGMRWKALAELLASHRQMIPLDPPFADQATVGGVIATNGCGPRRRLYGTARDLIIGMKFATVEGKLVQSGGMVVKNVAGLDMAKLMVGSFGTLAAMAVVNFKTQPMPAEERTFVLSFDDLDAAIAARNELLSGLLQPSAVDLLNPAAAASGLSSHQYLLAIRAGGSAAVMERYARELRRASDVPDPAGFWHFIENFTPRFLDLNPDGAVVRVSCTLQEIGGLLKSLSAPVIARAASGVVYAYFERAPQAAQWAARAPGCPVIEFSPMAVKANLNLWPTPGDDFDMMRRLKQMLDPRGLLNRGRLFGRI